MNARNPAVATATADVTTITTSTVAADAKAWSTIDQREPCSPEDAVCLLNPRGGKAGETAGKKSFAPPQLPDNDDAVLTISEHCDLARISPATERRLRKAGKGPIITHLSDNRIGVLSGTINNGSRSVHADSIR